MLEKELFFLTNNNRIRIRVIETIRPFKIISYSSLLLLVSWLFFAKIKFPDYYFSEDYYHFFYWPIYLVFSLNLYLKIIDRSNYFKVERVEESIVITKIDFTSNPYSVELPISKRMYQFHKDRLILSSFNKKVILRFVWKVKIDEEGGYRKITANDMVRILEIK